MVKLPIMGSREEKRHSHHVHTAAFPADSRSAEPTDRLGRCVRLRNLLVLGAVLALAPLAAVAYVVLSNQGTSNVEKPQQEWKSGVTPAWMSQQIGLRIPEHAADRRAGYRTSAAYDTGILTFTLPSDEAERYLSRLIPPGTEMIENLDPEKKDYKPMAPFSHLDLSEPKTLVEGMRTINFCPDDLDTPEGRQLQHCVHLFAHQYKQDATRIYVRSTIEPGVTPPPASEPG